MSGAPPSHAVTFVGGDAFEFAFQIKDKDLDAPEIEAVPRDLTGWDADAQIRQTPTADVVLATWAIQPLTSDGIRQEIPKRS